MDISLFDYSLPSYFIAKYPKQIRDNSNLLIFNRTNNIITHTKFYNILSFIDSNDILIGNDVTVIPARIFGKRKTGGKVEFLLVKKLDNFTWEVLIKSSKKLKKGEIIEFEDFYATIKNERVVEFSINLDYDTLFKINAHMPLPPYLKREDREIDYTMYQTVYSNLNKKGAIAAPTAGLHFTDELLNKLKIKGIPFHYITLYVGIGTFAPVRVEKIEEHKMHKETYEISENLAKIINNAKLKGKKIVGVGTTTVRALEDNFKRFGYIKSGKFETDIFIYPGFKFNVIDKLITNFHLPKSTLLMLVSAFAGRENILKCYEIAKEKNYKFFSYGDSMLII